MTVTEARAKLPEVLDRVLAGDEVTITRHGQPVAVVVRPGDRRVRRVNRAVEVMAADIGARLEAARRAPLVRSPGLTDDYAEELIAEIRAGRDAR